LATLYSQQSSRYSQCVLQGGQNTQDALNRRSLSAEEPSILGLLLSMCVRSEWEIAQVGGQEAGSEIRNSKKKKSARFSIRYCDNSQLYCDYRAVFWEFLVTEFAIVLWLPSCLLRVFGDWIRNCVVTAELPFESFWWLNSQLYCDYRAVFEEFLVTEFAIVLWLPSCLLRVFGDSIRNCELKSELTFRISNINPIRNCIVTQFAIVLWLPSCLLRIFFSQVGWHEAEYEIRSSQTSDAILKIVCTM